MFLFQADNEGAETKLLLRQRFDNKISYTLRI